jgi:hypothetical protein
MTNLQRAPGKSTLVEQSNSGAGRAQRAAPAQVAGGCESDDVNAKADAGTAGTGGKLPFLDLVQQSFGRHDISGIRAHTDEAAADASASLNARAYAHGNEVAFGGAPDLHTAAHEAAHVVQQRGGVSLKSGVGQAGDPHEQHADMVAEAVVRGERAEPLLDQVATTRGPSMQPGIAPVQRQQLQQPQPQPQQPVPQVAAQLIGSVGDGGANQPGDVRVVQDRLLALGFLSQVDHTAELVTPAAGQAQAVTTSAIQRTIAAIAAFSRAALGQPLLQITPAQIQVAALNATPVAAAGNVHLTGSVGVGGANSAADVRTVMDRLRMVGYLATAHHQAETAAIASVQGPVADSLIPRTLGALQRFLRETGGSMVQQVAPGSAEETILNSPPLAHDQLTVGTVRLGGAVGSGGANTRADVRAVQDRLRVLGYLAAAAYNAERVTPQGQGAVADATIPQTIAAIGRFSQELLGPPGVQQIAPGSPAAQALDTPPHSQMPVLQAGTVALTGAVGRGGGNAVGDVRAVQERLLAIGFLAHVDHAAERVNPQAVQGAVADAAIPRTIAAIQRFHREVRGGSLAQIRQGADEQALNSPPRFRQAGVEITSSVGTGGTNSPASVRAVQERLHDLGYLAEADFTAEQVDPIAQANIADAAITRTRAAIQTLQTTLGYGRLAASGLIVPGDVSHRLLMNPGTPVPQTIALGARIGVGGPSNAADVLQVQSRLRELGFLSTGDALAERPAAGVLQVADATMPRTLAAIRDFQASIVGVTPDGRIEPGGLSARLLQDPTYGTRTLPNPNATNPGAGPAPTNFAHEIQQIIAACETIEAGSGGRGERPAVLRNGSGTPASFGRGQLIGGTAVGTLQHNANIASLYGLSPQDLQDLNGISTRTSQHYNDIYTQVPQGGAATDVALVGLANAYINAHGQRFHAETGLFDTDVVAMFRTAQFRRHCAGQSAGAEVALMNAAQHPAAAANIAALSFARSDVRSYLTDPRRHGEHRAGFVTRALFMSEHGQQLRDAMTDNSGTGIGRALINDNYNLVVQRAAQLQIQLTVAQRAEVTARVHNQGEGNLNNFLNDLPGTHNDNYVTSFRQQWVP